MKVRRKGITWLLLLAILLPAVSLRAEGAQRTKSLYITQAQKLALSADTSFTKKYNEILLEKVKYEDAVRSVREKQRNMSTFRWSPLLSFKFPEKPNLSESLEFIFKPASIQANITTLTHEMNDLKYATIGKVNEMFSKCYLLQEQIAFNEEVLTGAQSDQKRVELQSKADPAQQAELDRLSKRVEKLIGDLSLQRRNFETAKKTLSDEIKLDVTTGYIFKDCLETLNITRTDLSGLVNHTLSQSQELFEAKMATQTAATSMDTAERLMRSFYGSNMNMLNSYLTQIRQGADVDKAAFQLDFRKFLEIVDKPWQGNIRILFIRIPKEWFKGQLSGIRYVEDEPYQLYTACMEYQSALSNQKSVEKSIKTQVEADFEGIITAHNAYRSTLKEMNAARSELDRLGLLNKQGKVDGPEVTAKQEDYQQLQMDALGMLSDYNELLTAYDRLTCGGITLLLSGVSLEGDVGAGGDSLSNVSEIDGPYYYMESQVQDMKFVFGVSIPEEFEPAISHYELWYAGRQVGSRTEITKQVSHLKLAFQNDAQTMEVRFYNDDAFVDSCEIDISVPRAALKLKSSSPPETETERSVGTYQIASQGAMGLSKLTLSPKTSEKIASYRLLNQQGSAVYSDEPIPAGQPLTYLGLLAQNLESLSLEFYDKDGELLYTGRLDTTTMQIMIKITAKGG